MILAGPHGYPTEKVLNIGNKIGGEVYNSTANKKGCSNYSDATKRKLEDAWPESMSRAQRQVILSKFSAQVPLSKPVLQASSWHKLSEQVLRASFSEQVSMSKLSEQALCAQRLPQHTATF